MTNQLFFDSLTDDYVQFSLATLVVYEYFSTIPLEMRVVWMRRKNFPAVLLVFIRYNSIFNIVVSFVMHAGLRPLTCTIIQRASEASTILTYIAAAIFASLRIYALWGRSVPLAVLVFGLSLVPAFTTVIYYIGERPSRYHLPRYIWRCEVTPPMPLDFHTELTRVTRVTAIAADLLVICLTWAKTFSTARTFYLIFHKMSIAGIMMRDGTIYFLIMLILNITQLVVVRSYCISQFIYTLTPILISRFMLNLRSLDDDVSSSGFMRTSRILSRIEFVTSSSSAKMILHDKVNRMHRARTAYIYADD
ncbi:hypothetical protein PHLGIDRAFT_17304 [Phlebiopsis gigantea 11061_1 CR5-6]|uniref:DUF6533 domain-containing protein n=1 Tax=Phlebiopsis gigantea (strain 11061_1 CR5-6) TaxID=745531 RepID=A0A0C3RPC0_PHLG1|nr:hypothetical protein PHLGIDRAFT_17304 [Phlebiopsis gigantea 11061_1 CR5-6]